MGTSASYSVDIANQGYTADSYTLATSGTLADDDVRRDVHDAADDDADGRRPGRRRRYA